MSIANTEQAEHWNTGPSVAHWVTNQARYDRMHAPFTALILQAAARLRYGLLLVGEESIRGEGPLLTRRFLEELFRRAPCPVVAIRG